MSVWNDQKIGDWTPTQLARFIQQTIFADPPPLPPSITLDSLSVIGDTEIGGELAVSSDQRFNALTHAQLPSIHLKRSTDQNVSHDNTSAIISMDTLEYTNDLRAEYFSPNLSSNYVRINKSGLYLIGAQVKWDNNGNGRRETRVEAPNGTVFAFARGVPGANIDITQNPVSLMSVKKGTALRLRVYQNSGGSLISHSGWGNRLWVVRFGTEAIDQGDGTIES